MGHHLYDENKRLKAENESLRDSLRTDRVLPETDVILDGIKGFFQGTARIQIEPTGGGFTVRFEH